jgi:hypothetical protein
MLIQTKFIGPDTRLIILMLTLTFFLYLLGILLLTLIHGIEKNIPSILYVDTGQAIFIGTLIFIFELSLLGLLNIFSQISILILIFADLVLIIKYRYFFFKINIKGNQNTIRFIVVLFLSIVFVPNSLSVPLGWDSLAFHLNLPKFYLNNGFYDKDFNIPQLGYFLGPDILNVLPLVTNELRLSSYISTLFVALILNSLIQIKIDNKYLSSSVLIIFFILGPAFMKFPATSFSVDYFLILISINLFNLFYQKKYYLRIEFHFFLVLYIYNLANSKFHSFILVIVWISLYLFLSKIKNLIIDKHILFSFILTLIPSIVWLLRNVIFFGNPFYPYLGEIFNRGRNYSKWIDPSTLADPNRFKFFNFLHKFELNINNYILTYEFLIFLFFILISLHLIKRYSDDILQFSLILSTTLCLIFLYFLTGDELGRYREFLIWILILYFITSFKKSNALRITILILILTSTVNFIFFKNFYLSTIKNNLQDFKSSKSSEVNRNYDQNTLLDLAYINYQDEKVLIFVDNRLTLLPDNFRAADTSKFSVLNYTVYNSELRINQYLKQNYFSTVIFNFHWGRPREWDELLWKRFLSNNNYCYTYEVGMLVICELKNQT